MISNSFNFFRLFKNKKRKNKKIAIIHYRVGGTDGVSLEIEKRKKILENHGCEVKLIAGPRSKKADYTIKELEWDDGVIPIIKQNSFVCFNRNDLDDVELKKEMNKIANIITKQLSKIQQEEEFDHVLVHNIFSFGGHMATSKALYLWIEKFKIPCLATHHDFYWEKKESSLPRNGYLRRYIEKYMPPKSKYIKHVVINSLAQKELQKRKGIKAVVVGDVFDFDKPKWNKGGFNGEFLEKFNIKPNDLVVLQATRIVPRKGIEIAIDYTKHLKERLDEIKGKVLYNGKVISSNSDVILVLAGYTETENQDYLFKLKNKILEEGISARFISEHISARRSFSAKVKKFSLWDAYVYADIVTYPSLWEGWGNQFIEAVFAKKPIVMYEYPVYRQDILNEGYHIISLGHEYQKNVENKLVSIPNKNIEDAVSKSIVWLSDKKLNKTLDENFKIGDKYHDDKILEKFLIQNLGLT